MNKATLFTMALLTFAAVSFSQDTAYVPLSQKRVYEGEVYTSRQGQAINSYYTVLEVRDTVPNGNGILWRDGEIIVVGDTLKAISTLVNQLMEIYEKKSKADNRVWELEELMNWGVKFLNSVPDHWKRKENNKAWPMYRAALIKQGWRVPLK